MKSLPEPWPNSSWPPEKGKNSSSDEKETINFRCGLRRIEKERGKSVGAKRTSVLPNSRICATQQRGKDSFQGKQGAEVSNKKDHGDRHSEISSKTKRGLPT